MLEPNAPPARNGPNTGSLAPAVRRRVNKKIACNVAKLNRPFPGDTIVPAGSLGA